MRQALTALRQVGRHAFCVDRTLHVPLRRSLGRLLELKLPPTSLLARCRSVRAAADLGELLGHEAHHLASVAELESRRG